MLYKKFWQKLGEDEKLNVFVATIGGIGRFKYAPGTIASLYSASIIYLMDRFLISKIGFNWKAEALFYIFFLLVPLFRIGTYSSELYSKSQNKQDPQEVVIDEALGMFISFLAFKYLAIIYNQPINLWLHLVAPFILFRFFDILKPWPISYIDKNMEGGLGIMLDDVLAGIFAGLSFWIFCYFV